MIKATDEQPDEETQRVRSDGGRELLSSAGSGFIIAEALRMPQFRGFYEDFVMETQSIINSVSSPEMGLKVTSFSSWFGLSGDRPPSRSPTTVSSLE